MGEWLRRWGVPTLMLVLVVVIGVGLATASPAAGDRVEALAEQLRCPVCQGESVADSPSETASAITQQIEEMVAAGRSDEEILDHYVARYGRWVLLEPPARGDTLLLWLLPLLALAAGLVVVLTRRRTARDTPVRPTASERAELRRRAAALREQEGPT